MLTELVVLTVRNEAVGASPVTTWPVRSGYNQRGEVRKRYREGQEDQLGALGLVVNAVALWTSFYLDQAVRYLRDEGEEVREEDLARISPLVREHVHVLERYQFTCKNRPPKGVCLLRGIPRRSTSTNFGSGGRLLTRPTDDPVRILLAVQGCAGRARRPPVRVRCWAMGEDTTGPYGTSSGSPSSQRVSVDVAARALGLSVDAVRKRVQRGTIPYEKDPAGRVTIILDTVETLQDEGETVQDKVRDTPGPGADRLLEAKNETIEELRGRVHRLEQDLDSRTEELRRRDHLLAAALERIPAIEPPEPPQAPETVAEEPSGTEPRRTLQALRRA